MRLKWYHPNHVQTHVYRAFNWQIAALYLLFVSFGSAFPRARCWLRHSDAPHRHQATNAVTNDRKYVFFRDDHAILKSSLRSQAQVKLWWSLMVVIGSNRQLFHYRVHSSSNAPTQSGPTDQIRYQWGFFPLVKKLNIRLGHFQAL